MVTEALPSLPAPPRHRHLVTPALALVGSVVALAGAVVFEFVQIAPTQRTVTRIEKALAPCAHHHVRACRKSIDGLLGSLSGAEKRALAAKLAPYLRSAGLVVSSGPHGMTRTVAATPSSAPAVTPRRPSTIGRSGGPARPPAPHRPPTRPHPNPHRPGTPAPPPPPHGAVAGTAGRLPQIVGGAVHTITGVANGTVTGTAHTVCVIAGC